MSEANGYASRDSFGARRYVDLTLPSGNKVRLRSLTQRELSATTVVPKKDSSDEELQELYTRSTVRGIIAATVDGDGNPLWRDPEDIDLLRDIDVADFSALSDAVTTHVLPKRSIEARVKNSDAIGSDASPTS